MLIKVLYLVFLAITDLLLYVALNKKVRLTTQLLLSYAIVFLVIMLLHTSWFHIRFLVSLNRFFILLEPLIAVIIFYFYGRYATGKQKRSPGKKLKLDSHTIGSFVYFTLMPILVFLLQCQLVFQFLR